MHDALTLGVTRDRLRSADLQKPFRGTRATGLDLSLVSDRCLAYLPRMRADHAFGFQTAAELYRFPLPLGKLDPDRLHVVAPSPARAPAGRGVCGHQARLSEDEVVVRRGLPLVSPAVAWCQATESLQPDDAVAVADWIVTGNPHENILPLATLEQLAAASAGREGGRGHATRVEALPLVREGPLSRTESLLRLVLVRAGLPEPELNVLCFAPDGTVIGMPDLAWPRYRVAGQYEGDHHRGQEQFRRDIRRDEKFVDNGWTVVKATADDLFAHPRELVERFARRLGAAGWRGSIDLRRVGRVDR